MHVVVISHVVRAIALPYSSKAVLKDCRVDHRKVIKVVSDHALGDSDEGKLA